MITISWAQDQPHNLKVPVQDVEKAMAPHSSTLAWKIPWAEEPGRWQSMGLLRVGHDWATSLSLFTFMHWRRKGQPTPVFLPGESQGRGSLVGYCLWVAQLKWRSSSSARWKFRSPQASLEVQWWRPHLLTHGVWVWCLVRELRSHIPCSQKNRSIIQK